MKKLIICLIALSAFLASCASYEPVLDYNDKYKAAGDEQAEKDIDTCEKYANEYLKNKKEEEAQKPDGRKLVGSGVLATGLIGSLSGPITEGTTPGNPVDQNTNYAYPKPVPSVTPKEAKQAYMKKCLEDQKYQVLGWE